MDLQKNQKQSTKCLIVLTACCIAAYLITFAFTNFFGFSQFCDTDMYADTSFSRLMWEQKSFFPNGWIFSNQYYVIATPVFAALFYGITDNINTAMVLATELMTIFILISFFWLLKAVASDPLEYLVSTLLLLSSVIAESGVRSEHGQLFYTQASYYACYLFTLFFVLGDYVRSFQSTKKRPAAWALSLFLSYATGIQSLRQTVVMVLPILACELLQGFRRILYGKYPWSKKNIGTLLRAVSYAIANFLGYLTSLLLNPPHSTLYGGIQHAFYNEYPERIRFVWEYGLRRITGFTYMWGEHFSAFYALFSLFLLILFVSATIIWLLRIKEQENPLKLCWLVCLVGIVGVSLSSVVFYISIRSIYLFTWYPLVAFSGLIVIKKLPQRQKSVLVVLISLLSLVNLYYSYLPCAKQAIQNNSRFQNTSFYSETDTRNANAKQLCDWAMDEGYEYVYGDWFTAPQIAVHSGGKLVAGYWWQNGIYCPIGYLNIQDIYGARENEKAIYVFTPNDEENGLRIAKDRGVTLTKVGEFGNYYAYTSPVPLLAGQPRSYE